jgi:hypothetical protein
VLFGQEESHTVKNQLAVRPGGFIEALSASVPGGATHDLTLLRQTSLLQELKMDAAAMLDQVDDRIQKDSPDVQLHQPYKAMTQIINRASGSDVELRSDCGYEFRGNRIVRPNAWLVAVRR